MWECLDFRHGSGFRVAQGAWFNMAAIRSWDKMAKRYALAAKKVLPAAQVAAEAHIVRPLCQAVMSDPNVNGQRDPDWDFRQEVKQVHVYEHGDRLVVGAPGQVGQRLYDMEIGDEEHYPTGHIQATVQDNRGVAVHAFYRNLMS